MSAMNWKAQAFIRGCAITNLSIRPETPREVTMSIFALPEELLTHIVAQVTSGFGTPTADLQKITRCNSGLSRART
jgi:hypothetical protein